MSPKVAWQMLLALLTPPRSMQAKASTKSASCPARNLEVAVAKMAQLNWSNRNHTSNKCCSAMTCHQHHQDLRTLAKMSLHLSLSKDLRQYFKQCNRCLNLTNNSWRWSQEVPQSDLTQKVLWPAMLKTACFHPRLLPNAHKFSIAS